MKYRTSLLRTSNSPPKVDVDASQNKRKLVDNVTGCIGRAAFRARWPPSFFSHQSSWIHH